MRGEWGQVSTLFVGSDVLVWHVKLKFQPWSQPPGSPKLRYEETYGKTQIVCPTDNLRTVAEIELFRRFKAANWNAEWVDTYGKAPRMFLESICKGAVIDPDEQDSLPEPLGTKYKEITIAANPSGKLLWVFLSVTPILGKQSRI